MVARMENIRSLLQHMVEQHQQSSQTPVGAALDSANASHPHSHRHNHAHAHGHSHAGEGPAEGLAGVQQSLTRLLQSSGIFFILLLLRFIYDHRLGMQISFIIYLYVSVHVFAHMLPCAVSVHTSVQVGIHLCVKKMI